MTPTPSPEIMTVFESHAPGVRARLLELRALIFATAAETDGVGKLHETLKWGEPAYLTAETKSGSTIRIGPMKKDPAKYCLFFNCQTTLVETFKQWGPTGLTFQGNRAVVFDVVAPLPRELASDCIAAALTYHLTKKRW
ncbi:MAG: DUF1801 domain-containing protein [Rhodothermales bacterium]|nr:DUF1801 domain-containing protein [Rhodothermales bacterium]